MASAPALRSDERIGLVVALALHAGLVAVLLWHPRGAPVVIPPDRIEVTISEDVGLKSTSPEPMAEAAPDVAPELGAPAPAEPDSAPQTEPPKPEPRAEPPAPEPPKPAPRPVAKPQSRPVAKPTMRPEPPRPVAKPTMRPQPRPSPAPARPAARPSAAPAPRPAARPPATRPSVADAFKQTPRPGGTRVGEDFLKGVPGARATGQSRNPPAQAASPQVRSSLLGAISRAVRPHWQGKVPEGADADKLVTILRWNLNRDGSLAGPVEFVGQEGRTDANKPQWERHKEQAIRAVQLAAPFDLPAEYYDAWKRVGPIRFDKRLSQ